MDMSEKAVPLQEEGQQADIVETFEASDHRQAELFFAEGRWGEAGEACQAAITAGMNLLEASYTEIGRQAEVEAMAQDVRKDRDQQPDPGAEQEKPQHCPKQGQ